MSEKTGVKGKNYTGKNSGVRKKNDIYETPYSATQQLIDLGFFEKDKQVLEPAAGSGCIVKVLQDNDFNVAFYDKFVGDIVMDFFDDDCTRNYIITNPPYSLAKEFVLHSKKICINKFAFLLPIDFLSSKERYDEIYQDKNYPLTKVCVFSRMMDLRFPVREDWKFKTAFKVYAWFVWENKSQQKNPEIIFIDNDHYVLRSRKKRR